MNPVLYPINILLVIFHEGQLFYCRSLYSKELESKNQIYRKHIYIQNMMIFMIQIFKNFWIDILFVIGHLTLKWWPYVMLCHLYIIEKLLFCLFDFKSFVLQKYLISNLSKEKKKIPILFLIKNSSANKNIQGIKPVPR